MSSWIYSLFSAFDANFRLKCLNVSNDKRDPGLNNGYAYLVEERSFKAFLAMYNTQIPDDTSDCNNYNAIKMATMQGGKGIAAMDVGTIECSRHDMKQPVSVGDLQKGKQSVV